MTKVAIAEQTGEGKLHLHFFSGEPSKETIIESFGLSAATLHEIVREFVNKMPKGEGIQYTPFSQPS